MHSAAPPVLRGPVRDPAGSVSLVLVGLSLLLAASFLPTVTTPLGGNALIAAAPPAGVGSASGALGVRSGSAHLFPIHPSGASAAAVAPSGNQTCNPQTQCGPLLYNGGPVMHDPRVVLVFWQPNGTTYENATSDPYAIQPSSANFRSIMRGFFVSANGSYWIGIAQQYTDSLGPPGTSVSVWGSLVDSHAFPCGACGNSTPLEDSQVQSEVQRLITDNRTPTGTNVEYFVFLPLNVQECLGSNCSFTSFCAYHSDFVDAAGAPVIYAVMPDVGTNFPACASFSDTAYPYGPNGDQVADWELNVVSHEFMESITDPEPSSGWVAASGYEIGDICAWVWTAPPSYQDFTDFVLDGHPYFLQPEWSNSANNCQQEPLPSPAVPSFAVHLPSAVAIGSTADVFVNATVTGGTADWGNVSVEFPSEPPLSSISIVAAGTTFPVSTVVSTGQGVTGCYSLCAASASAPMVVAEATGWPATREYSLEVALSLPTVGSFPLYVKAVAASGPSEFATNWGPTGTNLTDGLHENVSSYRFDVVGSGYYPVVFNESGLSPDTLWSLGWNGQNYSTTAANLTVDAKNGTYPYAVASAGWTASPPNGTLTVQGAGIAQSISFTRVLYPVTVTETGLPNGTRWWFNVTGGGSFSTVGSSIVLSEPNGSYAFQTKSANATYVFTSAASFTVNGGALDLPLPFHPFEYSVKATASGAPSGTEWWWNVSGAPSLHTNGTSLALSVPNGTYSYLAHSVDAALRDVTGAFRVQGAPAAVTISFVPETFPVTFDEIGLPTGSMWWTNLSSARPTGASTTVSLPNGSYSFSAGSANSSFAAPPGRCVVNGGPETVSIDFSLVTFSVVIDERGLPSGTNWSVTLGGGSESSTSGSLTFQEPSGSDGFVVGKVPGYVASPSSGRANVSGGPVEITVVFARSTTPSGGEWLGLGGYSLDLFLVLGAVVLAAGVIALARRQRRDPASRPPVR